MMEKINPPTDVFTVGNLLIWSSVVDAHGYNIYAHGDYMSTVKGPTSATICDPSDGIYQVVSLGKSFGKTIYSSKSDKSIRLVKYSEAKDTPVAPSPPPPAPTGSRIGTEPDNVVSDYQLVFEDQFDTGSIDPEKWSTQLPWGENLPINGEEQHYTDTQDDNGSIGDNPFIFDSNSSVAIRSSLLSDSDQATSGQKYGSGKLCSVDNFVYGYFEARIRLPCDIQGFWGGFWLLNRYYGSHPLAVGENGKREPEIDIEFVSGTGKAQTDGGFGGGPYDINHIRYAYHYDGGSWSIDGSGFHGPNDQPGQSSTCDGRGIYHHSGLKHGEAGDICDEYHNHGILWEPERIVYYLDGIEQDSICHESIISQVPMYLIVNQAVGGNFPGPANVLDYMYGVDMDIDWIRVFQKV